jgi:hypothetical protein
MTIENLRVGTWSHTSYSELWPMYYGQFERHASFLPHCVFLNEKSDLIPTYCKQIINNENHPYHKRFIQSLEEVEEDYFLYMQEDYVLYDDVKQKKIENIVKFLEKTDYSFVRLIKSGVEGGTKIDDKLNLIEFPRDCQYYFAVNSAIWKKEDFSKLYKFFTPNSILDSELYGSIACKSLGIKGCYVYEGEPKRGNMHYDSNIFPYISSALVGGSTGRPAKWLTSHYPKELGKMFEIYNIDPTIRGTR